MIIFLIIISVKFLSMNFILLTWYKFVFCEMILNGEPCKRSGREVLREEMFENKTLFSL